MRWLLLCSLLAAPLHAQLSVELNVERAELFFGEATNLTLTVYGVDALDPPKIEGDGFETRFVAASPGKRSSIVIVNGQTQRQDAVWLSLNYVLRPTRSGRMLLPPQKFEVRGQELQTQPVLLNVQAPTDPEFGFIETWCDPPHVYIGQGFELVLDVHLRRLELDGELLEVDPGFPDNPLRLQIPWVESLEGCAGAEVGAVLNPLLDDAGLFRINDYTVGSSLFGREARFKLERSELERDGRAYYRYRFRRRFEPQRAGTLAVPPASLGGNLAIDVQPSGNGLRASPKEVRVLAETLFLPVKSPPREGRPDFYNGAVGAFEVSASVTPQAAGVGDPITLSLRIQGPGVALATPPQLAGQAGMELFKLSEDPSKVSQRGDTKTYVYTLRATSADVQALPSLAYVFFDPRSESYQTARTEALPLAITARGQLSLDLVEGRGAFDLGAEQGPGLTVAEQDAAWLEDATPPWYGSSLRGPDLWWALAVLLGPPLLAAARLLRRWLQRRETPASRRRKQAWSQARAALRTAQDQLSHNPQAAVAAAEAGLRHYVCDLLDLPASGQTGAELLRELRQRGLPEAQLSALQQSLGASEGLRFSGGGAAQAPELLARIEGVLAGLRAPLSALLLLLMLLAPAAARTPLELLEDARGALRQASALDGDSAQAALKTARADLEAITAQGIHNAALYTQLGNISLRLSDPVAAIVAYRRALRYAPGSASLHANLGVARELAGSEPPPPDWLDEVLFWRSWCDDGSKALLAALLWCVGWLWWGFTRKRRGWAWLPLLLAGLLYLSGYLHQRAFLAGEHGVVAQPAFLYRGDAESYGKRFENPVPAGSELRIEQRSPGWLRIRLAEGSSGWMPADAVVELFPSIQASGETP